MMSCIPKILEMKGEQKILPLENIHRGIVVESGGSYKGYDYLITLNDMGIRCAYVAIGPDHPTFNYQNEHDPYPDYDVHGGVTFFGESHISKALLGDNACKDIWIGFDAGHYQDKFDIEKVKEYFKTFTNKQIDEIYEVANFPFMNSGLVRNIEYMETECKNLIDQLIEDEAA